MTAARRCSPTAASGQAEAIRVPLANGTLAVLPAPADSALAPSLVTLSDVFGTAYHAAVRGGVTRGSTVAVVGNGAVRLLAALSARLLGAERIVLMGRYKARTDLGREFGATDVVAERGDEGVERVRELTGGHGASMVLEAVGHRPAYEQAYGIVRPGGVISRIDVPQYEEAPIGFGSLFGGNVTLTGGPAPTRAYAETLLPHVLDGTVEPGRVFDRTVGLDSVPDGYRASRTDGRGDHRPPRSGRRGGVRRHPRRRRPPRPGDRHRSVRRHRHGVQQRWHRPKPDRHRRNRRGQLVGTPCRWR